MKKSKIVFFKDSHTYWYGDRKLPSVGKYLGKYFPEYNEKYWLVHSALKDLFGDEYVSHYRSFSKFMPDSDYLFLPFLKKVDPEEYGNKRQEIKWKWERKRNQSAYKGTMFHDEMEAKAYKKCYLVNPFDEAVYQVKKYDKEFDNESLMLNLYELEDGAYPELLVFDPELTVAGQADEVYIETINGVRYIDINDHKTNEKKPQASAPEFCLDPISHMYASTHNKYVLQINLYAHLLSKHGFIPRNLGYTHYKKYDPNNLSLIIFDVISEEIELILEKS